MARLPFSSSFLSFARFARFARSALAGGAATLVDLGVLGFAVGVLHATAAAANLPAALAGAVVQFIGNRRFAFRSKGPLGREAALFAATEAVTLALNVGLFHLVATLLASRGGVGALGAAGAVVARALTTNLVFVAWSYPAWKRVFAPPSAPLQHPVMEP
jgi:putative flippase GtrA